jgi:hypothetical protein
MAPIRRLTVLQDTSADNDRPAWHWTPIGVLFALSTWAPLAMLAVWASKGVVDKVPSRVLLWLGVTAPPLLSFGFSCWAAGALVGRFGAGTAPRQTAAIGAEAAVLACAAAFVIEASATTSAAALALLVPLGAAGGWFGGRFGVERRRAAATRPPPPPTR